jgi:hypothetical protein
MTVFDRLEAQLLDAHPHRARRPLPAPRRIVAFAAAAVPETVADAGVVLADKAPATVAAAVHRVAEDQPLAESLVAAGCARLADFRIEPARAAFGAAVESMVARL